MDSRIDKVINLTNIISDGQRHYVKRNVVIWPKGCCNTLTAAMGMGGGYIQLLMTVERL